MSNTEYQNTIEIPLEALLRKQLYTALHGDVITAIIKEAKVQKAENFWRNLLEGHSFKVDEKISGKMYTLFNEVKNTLNFSDPLDFYITSASDINAFAICSLEEDEPNIININSALLNLMNDEELKFVIGHEIGHLISKNAEMHQLINFVYPPSANQPALLRSKIRLWNQLSELIADRYGFNACKDLSTCISAFFKMSSGLDSQRVDLDIEAFLAENQKRLEFFMKAEGLNVSSHPVNPVRIKAIELFANSEQFSGNPQEIQKQMDILIQVLLKIKSSELDVHRSYFIASAGLVTAGIDGELDAREMDILMQSLSEFYVFPSNFLDQLAKSGKVEDYLSISVQSILEINPAERESMLGFMINMVMVDKKIEKKELDFIFHVGENVFGYSRKEIAQHFAARIQQSFIPSTHDLC